MDDVGFDACAVPLLPSSLTYMGLNLLQPMVVIAGASAAQQYPEAN